MDEADYRILILLWMASVLLIVTSDYKELYKFLNVKLENFWILIFSYPVT